MSGDEHGILFVQLCNVLDPGIAVALSSVSNELRTATRVPLQQLKTGHEAAAALCRKLGHRNCKELREAKLVDWCNKGLTADKLAVLGTLGSVLPALETLHLCEPAAGPEGERQLAWRRGWARSRCRLWPSSVSSLRTWATQAPRRSPPPWDKAPCRGSRSSSCTPALRLRPALEGLALNGSPIGDEGLAARRRRQVRRRRRREGWRSSTGSTSTTPRSPRPAAPPLAAAFDSGALPALKRLHLLSIPASAAAKAAVNAARANLNYL